MKRIYISVHPIGRKMEFKGGAEFIHKSLSLPESNRLQESALCMGDKI